MPKLGNLTKGLTKGGPASGLTKGYVIALAIIACLTGLSHLITSRMIEHEIAAAEISYSLSQEVNLVAQVERYASGYYASKEDYDKTFLVQRLDDLKAIHGKIETYLLGKANENEAKEGLRKVMLQEPFSLSKKITTFINDADYFLTYDKESMSPERQAALKKVTTNIQMALIKPLQFSLEDYQETQIQEIRNLHGLQFYMAVGILVVILLEALFIFMPLVRKVEKYNDTLMRLSMEDVLTGLKNRRALTKDFQVIQKVASRENKKFVVAVCDLDKFKSINDTYGHDIGDLVLKSFSQILTKTLRPTDIIARMGGEEFVIILSATDAQGAKVVLERLRQKTQESACRVGQGESAKKVKYTTSIGYVEGPLGEATDLESYFKLADEALYRAKTGGRNRIVDASGPSEEQPRVEAPQSEEVLSEPVQAEAH